MAQKEKFITVMAVFDDETQAKLQAFAEELAKRYGPDVKTAGIPYHISLGSYPVEDTDEIVSRIREVASKTRPFEVNFLSFCHFNHTVRWIEPEESAELFALHAPFDSDYANGWPGWMPHVTVYRHSAPAELREEWVIPEKAVVTGIELGEFFPAKKIMSVKFE